MSGYVCSMCDDPADPVVQLHVNLTNGQTAAMGANCLPVALIGALAVELDTDPQRLYDVIRKFADREAKSAAKAQAQAGQDDSQADVEPPERSDDIAGDAVDDQGGMSEASQLAALAESEVTQ